MIDTATDHDLPALASMLYALNAQHAAQLPARFHTDGQSPDLTAFLAQAMEEGARVLLYRTEGVPRGYLMWQLIERPETPLERPGRIALLDHIYVEPIWRRRGLGQRLIARFEREIAEAGCDSWITRVHAFNGASAALMQEAGARLSVQVFEKPLQTPA
ncbi:GNAT family N-acetyltransferase [Antarctobacter jejuensis]|uniref:GNAT family N-acetyltransferase n=1 Tax=Antarctobacter jejuensis TaxID=1439938 RepID=UPI003FD00635